MAILTPAIVYRRYVVDGVPDSGAHDPKKAEIIQLLDTLFGANDAAWVVAPTLAALVMVTPDSERDGGIVLSDPDPTKNGYYYRAAAAWVRGRGFPDSLAVLDDIEGTANAITASTRAWVNPSDVQMMIFEVAATVEAGGVTMALNGGAAKPLVTNSGSAIGDGYLAAGMLVSFIDDGANYRLVSDVASLAVLAGAEAAAVAAEASADEAADYAELARSNWLPIRFAGNGVTTDFNLGVDPGSGNNCFVSIEGVLQDTTTYSLAGTILTFLTAPPGAGLVNNIEVRMGTAIAVGAPADGSITNPKIGAGAVDARTLGASAVTKSKIADDSVDASKIDDGDLPAIQALLGIADTTSVSFSAHKNGSAQTGIAAATKLTFGTEEWDDGSYYDAANSRFTPPPGRYELSVTAYFSAGVADQDQLILYIYKNGAIHRSAEMRASGAQPITHQVTSRVSANGTDYFEAFAVAGGSNKTVAGSAIQTNFQGNEV